MLTKWKQPVNVITFGLAQSDHIKRLLLYYKMKLRFFFQIKKRKVELLKCLASSTLNKDERVRLTFEKKNLPHLSTKISLFSGQSAWNSFYQPLLVVITCLDKFGNFWKTLLAVETKRRVNDPLEVPTVNFTNLFCQAESHWSAAFGKKFAVQFHQQLGD